MSQQTDIVIKFKTKEYPVPANFTAEEYKESLAMAIPEAANAQLIKDGEKNGRMEYTLKPTYGEKG